MNRYKFFFFTWTMSIFGSLAAQPYGDYLGAGHNVGIIVTASSSLGESSPQKTIDGSGLDAPTFDASRFLAQATFGAKLPYIEQVRDMGYENWIDDQFTKPATYLTPKMWQIWQQVKVMYANGGEDTTDIFGPYSVHFNYTWWDVNMTNEDLLRQRIAQALSEIVVISINSDIRDWAEALTSYHDMLLDQSFGNYRDLLTNVSLHTAMGYYLSHFNNPKTDTLANIRPDENYAREVMQLFTIGLYMLNQDGTLQLDSDGNPIPTYDNADIKEMAKVFTGLGCGELEEGLSWPPYPMFGVGIWASKKGVPMQMFEEYHELGPKHLMNGFTIPAGQSGMDDISDALDFLFNHQNTPPFVSYRMIQRLVKSNPSPEYVGRVAAKFIDNGSGIRGDMKAVVKAILLDPEARTAEPMLAEENGQFRNGTLKYLQLARSMNLNSPFNRYWYNGYDLVDATLHMPYASPSVFNFYLPNYQPIGPITNAGLVAPEFKQHNTSSSINYINRVMGAAFWDQGLFWSWMNDYGDQGIGIDYTYLMSIADDTELMINELDKTLTHGQLSDQTRLNMRQTLNTIKSWWTWDDEWKIWNSKVLVYLFMISPDYNCLK